MSPAVALAVRPGLCARELKIAIFEMHISNCLENVFKSRFCVFMGFRTHDPREGGRPPRQGHKRLKSMCL